MERAAYAVQFEVADPRLALVTLIRCELSKDLAHAKLFYSVFGSEADQRSTQRALESASGFIQRQVGRVLRTRRIPRLAWHYDDSVKRAADMDQKIRAAIERDRAIHAGRTVEGEPPTTDGSASEPDANAGTDSAFTQRDVEHGELDEQELAAQTEAEYREFVEDQDEHRE